MEEGDSYSRVAVGKTSGESPTKEDEDGKGPVKSRRLRVRDRKGETKAE